MKLDIKSILILVLLGFCLLFGHKWYFSTGNSEYKKQLKELRVNNKILQNQRDSINVVLKELEVDFDDLKEGEKIFQQKIDSMNIEIDLSKLRVLKLKDELDKLKGDLSETRKKIKELKENPSNREGNELLNSLKNNLKP